jgi:hypothetical protein
MKKFIVFGLLAAVSLLSACQTQTFEFRPSAALGPAIAESLPLQSVRVTLPKRTVFGAAEKSTIALQWERAIQEVWIRSKKSAIYQRCGVEVTCENIELRKLGYVVEILVDYAVVDLGSGRTISRKRTSTSGRDSAFGGIDRLIAALNVAIQTSIAEFADSIQKEPNSESSVSQQPTQDSG